MKRIFALFLTFVLTFALAACVPITDQRWNKDKSETLFNEVITVDNDQCLIKITDIDPDGTYGYSLKVRLENKSLLKTYWVEVESASVNGVQCPSMFEPMVLPRAKLDYNLYLLDETLRTNGVGDYTDIELTFCVYDDEDMLDDPIFTETVHVYPYGEEHAAAFIREPQDTDQVIIDNESITVIITGYEEDAILGYNVNLYFVNKSDKQVTFSAENACVNGSQVGALWGISHVSPGKCGFTSIVWDEDDMEAIGMTDVDEVQFTLFVYDEDTFLNGLFEEVITINP